MNNIPEGALCIGYQALIDRYALKTIPHFRQSFILEHGARRVIPGKQTIYLYDRSYALENPEDPFEQLAFGLKHEGLSLAITKAFFAHVHNADVTTYICKNISGKYQRMIWYLYELLTDKQLAITDLTQGSYIDLLDPQEYYTSTAHPKKRYRINDNLLGNKVFCPFVRRTSALETITTTHIKDEIAATLASYNPKIIERASMYLYTKETMSSYLIERERPNKQRLAKFIQSIKHAETVSSLTKDMLIKLQNALVHAQFINTDYRTTQVYIGQIKDLWHEIIHYIGPQPESVAPLMEGLLASLERMLTSNVHPIIIAGALSFGFVYIHPFDDGNGRLHRFIIHWILQHTGFTPTGMIFPISAVILAQQQQYDAVLEEFSRPLMKIVAYRIDQRGIMTVSEQTDDLYRFIDYTSQVEFLAHCIKTTIATDFKNELEYLVKYDAAHQQIAEIVDMPDRLINLFITLSLQNKGSLSLNKRKDQFSALTDQEIASMENVIKSLFFTGPS